MMMMMMMMMMMTMMMMMMLMMMIIIKALQYWSQLRIENASSLNLSAFIKS